MAKKVKLNEAEYAKLVVEYYEDLGYEVYKEVGFGGSSMRADIYCKKGNETIAIEVKSGLNLKVLDQAWKWRPFASKVYIAIPYQKYRYYDIAKQMCEDYGIGILTIYHNKRHNIKDIVIDKLEACINVSPKEPKLYEAQKDSVAGAKGGETCIITPFKGTCIQLVDLIREKGPMPLKIATSLIDHHYKNPQSANQNLRKMILWGVIKELELFKEGRSYGVRIRKNF